MTALTPIAPRAAHEKVSAGAAVFIDIREPDEYARAHIPGALSMPLSAIAAGAARLEAGRDAIFHCRTGMRTNANCDRLAAHAEGPAYVLEGGFDAWRAQGLPVEENASAPLELNRQVQITAGLMVLLGVVLGFVAHPGFFGVSAFVGAGLTFAGASGWCGMAHLLAAMPWNRAARSGAS